MSRLRSTSPLKKVSLLLLAVTALLSLSSMASASSFVAQEDGGIPGIGTPINETPEFIDDQDEFDELIGSGGGGAVGTNDFSFDPLDAGVDQVVIKAAEDNGEVIDLLPAYRWQSSADLYARCERDGVWVLGAVTKGLCELSRTGVNAFMVFAQFTWSLSLGMFRYALTASAALTGVATSIFNPIFMAVYNTVSSGGLIIMAAMFVFFVALRTGMRSDKGRSMTFRLLIVGLLPLGLLQFAGTATSADIANGVSEPSAGTPLWFANFFNNVITETTSRVSSTMMEGVGSLQTPDDNSTVNCNDYTRSLEAMYAQAKGANKNLIPVSQFWEGAFLPAFYDAQYGPGTDISRSNIFCHQLEAQAGTPRAEQARIGVAAGFPGTSGESVGEYITVDSLNETTLKNDYCEGDWMNEVMDNGHTASTKGVDGYGDKFGFECKQTGEHAWFFHNDGRRDPYLASTVPNNTFASLMMWDACSWNGSSWSVQGDYDGLLIGDYGVRKQDCQVWWATGMPARYTDKPSEMNYDDSPDLNEHGFGWDSPPGANVADDKVPTSSSIADIRELSDGLRGASTSTAFLSAILALFTGLIYMVVFAGMSITVLLASIASTILWACFPLTLVLLAIDAVKGGKEQAKQGPGMKMLRMTAGYTLFASIATLFLTVALVMTTLVGQALEGIFSSENGPLNVLLQGLSPIFVFFTLRKLAKKIGVGAMMTPGGAVAMGALGGLSAASRTVTNSEGKEVKAGLGARMREMGQNMGSEGENSNKAAQRWMSKLTQGTNKATGTTARMEQREERAEKRASERRTKWNALLASSPERAGQTASAVAEKLAGVPIAGYMAAAAANKVENKLAAKSPKITHRDAALNSKRLRSLDAEIAKKNTEISEKEAELSEEPKGETPEEKEAYKRQLEAQRDTLKAELADLQEQRYGIGDTLAANIARSGVNGRPLISENGEAVMSAVDAYGVRLNDEALEAHVKQYGFESTNGVTLELADLKNQQLSVEAQRELSQQFTVKYGTPEGVLQASRTGDMVVDITKLTPKIVQDHPWLAAEFGTTTQETMEILEGFSVEDRVEILLHAKENAGGYNRATAAQASNIEVRSNGKLTVDSAAFTKALADIENKVNSSEARQLLACNFSTVDLERAIRDYSASGRTESRSMISNAEEEISAYISSARAQKSFKGENGTTAVVQQTLDVANYSKYNGLEVDAEEYADMLEKAFTAVAKDIELFVSTKVVGSLGKASADADEFVELITEEREKLAKELLSFREMAHEVRETGKIPDQVREMLSNFQSRVEDIQSFDQDENTSRRAKDFFSPGKQL